MSAPHFPFSDPPLRAQYQPCIKCGLCLDSCPTFQETGRELESPRGRVQLIAAVARGTVPLSAPKVQQTLFSCLDCRACEVACPSGVPIGSLIEKGRGQVVALQKSGRTSVARPAVTRTTRLALKYLLAHPARLRRIGWAFSRAQRLGLVKRSYRALPIGVRRIAESLPPLTALSRRPLANASDGKPVGVFVGCVMDVLFRDANDATIRVLNRNGFRPSVPAAQTCCGALAIHAGERELARQLARRNIDAFLSGDLDYVVTNAGGCGAALMEYPEWLADDPIYQERAIQFAEKVADIAQVLDKEGWQPPTAGPATVVTYQMSCHLQNVMKAGTAPANILTKIPGVDFRAMADSGRCCGSAGIYNITHPEMAEALLKRKMADIPEGTETIVTGNPGCWMQMLHGVDAYRPSLRVRHLVQVLDDAYAYQSAHDPVAIGASE